MNKSFSNKTLDPLIHFLKIPSISTQDAYLDKMAEARHYLTDLFSEMGFKVTILKGKKHDAVFAQLTTNNQLPTVLIYGHYDVQPPEPLEEWKNPPFEPTIKDYKIYARGTTDNKGQLMIHIMAVKKLLEKGLLPINFKFIIEGEEEIGSISTPEIIKRHGNSLKCDYLIVSDSEMPKANQPSIDISLRGLTYAEIILKIGEHDLHSGQFGGVAENPAVVLARITSSLKNEEGRILIPGFYDGVKNISSKELSDFTNLKVTADVVKKEGEIYALGGGEAKYSINERRWSRPTLDVNGMWSGYEGKGTKTIIPKEAGAKISMRLVSNQDPNVIYQQFVDYVKSIIPKNCKVRFIKHAESLPYKAPIDNPVFDLIKKSLEKGFGKKPVYTGVGGSIGFVPLAAKFLKVPVILVGFGLPTDDLHAPNEHLHLTNYFKGIEVMEDFYKNLGNLNTNAK